MYETLDSLILAAIKAGRHALYDMATKAEAERIASVAGRDEMRVIDARLTALKKAGRITFVRGKRAHWEVVEQPAQEQQR